jgi:hypothetical protein
MFAFYSGRTSDCTTYTVFHPDHRHVMLFTGPLDQVAECLAAQPEGSPLKVYASSDGFPRSLRPEEQARLDQAVAEARSAVSSPLF